MQNYNYAAAYNRPQGQIIPQQVAVPNVNQGIDFAQWGLVPNVAQNAQDTPASHFVTGRGYFTPSDFNLAQWFTTRVHLRPLADLTNGS